MKPATAAKRRGGRVRAEGGRIGRSLLWLLGLASLGVAAYACGGIYGGPWLIERWLTATADDAGATITLGAPVRVNPFALSAEISAIEIAGGSATSGVRAERIALDLSAASLRERRVVISSLLIEAPAIELERRADLGNAARRLHSMLRDAARIDRLEITDARLTTADPAPSLFDRFSLSLTGVDADSGSSARFRFDAAAADGATLAMYGTVEPDLSAAAGQFALSGADLAVLARGLGGPIAASAPTGRLAVSSAFTAQSLLTAPTLLLGSASVELDQLGLAPAAGLVVSSPRIDAGASLSLRRGAGDGAVRLGGRLEIDAAALSLRDANPVPAVTHELPAATVLVTADPATDDLTLLLDGRLTAGGTAALSIRVPAAATTTRRVSLRAQDLPPNVLSAYARAALGRGIVSGMTDLETDFVLADARVDGTLHVVARGLEFAPPAGAIGANGNAGADPTDPLAAAAAPAALDLAAALLEDTAGVIELELPFAGSASSARAAAAAALNARLAALSETPFDALATLMAGEPGTAGSVPFQPGDTALNDRAQAAIRQLVTVLTERPRLVLRVHGGFDATADRNALARQQIQLHVQLATAIAASQQARAVDFSSSRAQDVLDEFARERLPAATVAELKAQFECEGAMIPLCRRAYYELVFDALVESEAIAATTLTRLARFRALSITDALGAAGIASERLEVIMPGELADSPFGVGLKVELAAAAP